MKRRRLLHGTGILLTGALGGCSSAEERPPTTTPPERRTETPTVTDTASAEVTESETQQTNGTAEPTIYISEILANPEGPDTDAVGDEYVLVEVAADTEQDLSGYTLAYGIQHEYVFPDLVSAVEVSATIDIHSGQGTDGVSGSERPTYTLFADSDTPLLANEGMRLTLHDRAGTTVDSVTYWSMGEGDLYVRPET